MPIEKSAGSVIFRREPFDTTQGKKTRFFYLLLNYPNGARKSSPYWDFPKGHIEKGESLEGTVRREVKEETGLSDIVIISGFKETIKYFFNVESKNILKFVTFYLAETQEKNIKISEEHIGFIWLPYKKALEKLTFKNAKGILEKADDFLSSR